MPAPLTCGETLCQWRSPAGRRFVLVRDTSAFAQACTPGAWAIASAPAPADFAQRCSLTVLIDAPDLARGGGGFIYEGEQGAWIERAKRAEIRRAWTPVGPSAED